MSTHLILAHFPLVLFVLAAAADLFGAFTDAPAVRRAAGMLIVLGAVAVLLSFLTGEGALSRLLLREAPDPARLEAHTQWAVAGVWLLGGAGVLRALWRAETHGVRGWINLGVAVLAAVLVVFVTLSGTAIAHGW